MRTLRLLFVASIVSLFAATASAIPALQLGPGSVGGWTYDTTTETWVTSSSTFQLLATANATMGDGGNGFYAWDAAGADDQIAYLVVSAMPKTSGPVDSFNITIDNDGASLDLVTSGFGAPPISDTNSLAPHGIWDTYFEIYEFNFEVADGTTTISDSQPGETGMGEGFEERFDIVVNSFIGSGVHFDLFTMEGDGTLFGNTYVKKFAPWSHDAEMIPEPTAALVFGMGLLVVGSRIRRP